MLTKIKLCEVIRDSKPLTLPMMKANIWERPV